MRAIPSNTFELVKRYEGLRLKRYNDVTGHPTIGFGHLCKDNDGLMEVSETHALEILHYDLGIAANAVLRLTKTPLNDNQFAALIDFVFNLGSGLFQASTLRAIINRRDFKDAPKQFERWVYSGSFKLNGLIARRKEEAKLFLM